MIKKTVVLNIICFKNPCCLTILSENGCFIKKIKLNSIYSKICIKTLGQSVILKANNKCNKICKTVLLNNSCCQKIFVNLLFSKNQKKQSYNLIVLTDANYGFPILNAVLTFNQITSNLKLLN